MSDVNPFPLVWFLLVVTALIFQITTALFAQPSAPFETISADAPDAFQSSSAPSLHPSTHSAPAVASHS